MVRDCLLSLVAVQNRWRRILRATLTAALAVTLAKVVKSIGLTLSSLTMVGSLKFVSIQTTGFAAEDLRGMIAKKRSIAQAPEARTIAGRKVCGWRSRDSLWKIDVGLPGVFVP